MPELPEVETARRVLEQRYAGQAITAVAVGRPTFYREPPIAAIRALTGGRIQAFRRRGKYLIVELEGRGSVVFHLGMSGRLTVGGESPHVRFQFWVGSEAVRFHDSRRFGRVGCPLPDLGLEPRTRPSTPTICGGFCVNGPPRSKPSSWTSGSSPGSGTSTRPRPCIARASGRAVRGRRMQEHVKVYGRSACATCRTALMETRKSIGGRRSLYCPACQR